MSIKPSHKSLWCDHAQHVKDLNRKVKAAISANTEWAKCGDSTCLLWIGGKNKRQNPIFRITDNKFNAVTQYQRMYPEVYLPPGHVWSKPTCGRECCIRHRFPQTRSEFGAAENKRRSADGVFALNCARASRSRSPYTPERIALMHKLHADGMSSIKIAKELGAKHSSVRHILGGNRWAGVKHEPSGISFITSQLLGARA